MAGEERVIGSRTLSAGQFIVYKELDWVDAKGREHTWETADRAGVFGAVLIIPILKPSGRIVVIRQYRPPADRHVYEFPAGIIDGGESAEETAARELREETGFVAAAMTIWPAAFTSPGLSNESVHVVTAEIDETAPENRNPQTAFDGPENIETLFIEASGLADFYRAALARGEAFDAKLAAYIVAKAL